VTQARPLRIGTRASALALWQARHVAGLIGRQPGAPSVELLPIRTEGDMRNNVPLWAVDGRAFFTKEIDRALCASEIDVAVHSLKDLSTLLEPGIDLVAVIEREDPRDALLCRTENSLAALSAGARVGTSSLRRRAFLARARPDIQALELRGNVPTRIEKLEKGDYDAIILATAGLKRLGRESSISVYLSIRDFPPAVSQGAIGVCARSDDAETLLWLRQLDDPATRLATTAERTLLRRIEGGCQVPLGALATLDGETLSAYAAVCTHDGSTMLNAEGTVAATPANAVALGERLAEALLAKGAGLIIARERATPRVVEAP